MTSDIRGFGPFAATYILERATLRGSFKLLTLAYRAGPKYSTFSIYVFANRVSNMDSKDKIRLCWRLIEEASK